MSCLFLWKTGIVSSSIRSFSDVMQSNSANEYLDFLSPNDPYKRENEVSPVSDDCLEGFQDKPHRKRIRQILMGSLHSGHKAENLGSLSMYAEQQVSHKKIVFLQTETSWSMHERQLLMLKSKMLKERFDVINLALMIRMELFTGRVHVRASSLDNYKKCSFYVCFRVQHKFYIGFCCCLFSVLDFL